LQTTSLGLGANIPNKVNDCYNMDDMAEDKTKLFVLFFVYEVVSFLCFLFVFFMKQGPHSDLQKRHKQIYIYVVNKPGRAQLN